MKKNLVSLSVLAVCLAAVPALADTGYNNGPINGTTDAWVINFGFVVSDSFTLISNYNVTGISFGAWMFPGDVLQSAEVSITSSEFGGTTFYDQVVNFTQSGCSGNQYGYNVCIETSDSSFGSVNLAGGTYWLNLQNAVVPNGDVIYWDENSGPSSASENKVGTIPSESFTILGAVSSSTSGGSVPEPSSVILLASGILGVAGILRRKLF